MKVQVMMSKQSNRWYYSGLIGLLVAVIAFQLIWLPAPYVMSAQLEWIEVINWLYYVLLLIPLCWLIGAWLSWRQTKSEQTAKREVNSFLQIIIMAGSAALIVLLSQPLQYLAAAAILLAIVILAIGLTLYYRLGVKRLLWRGLAYALALLVLLCPTGYNVTYPGMTMNMNSYAQLQLAQDERTNGWIDGVLVFERPAFPIDWLYEKLLQQIVVEKAAENEPSINETYRQVVQMKNNANELAAAVAWQQAGKGQAIYYDGVQVAAIMTQSPADGVLEAGDIITAVNQVEIVHRDELLEYMSGYVRPGEEVELQLLRQNERKKVVVGTMPASEDEQRPVLGIAVQDAYHIDLELDVSLAAYIAHAGGPSHGAMLTLALYDQLTAADVTKGLHIAGTGTIEVDGSIGMVGGIPQKAYAVGRTDADVFFVPLAGMEAAKAAAPHLNIVGVEHFEDVLSWIEQH
ncbi:PDZ domain-containing protein [Paenibacillus camelliae]|uniref:PDZ domain-containing protein n=1 Tax=Paenibacillus camelliae TaxID=512410 RepID=UPI00203AD708|nr:PDZ domain-containing protein [Paenibacillus camelliae]